LIGAQQAGLGRGGYIDASAAQTLGDREIDVFVKVIPDGSGHPSHREMLEVRNDLVGR
jgi:hypothetical protein